MSLKEILAEMHELFPKLVEALELLQKSHLYTNPKPLDRVDALAQEVHKREKALTEQLVKAAQEEPRGARYVAVPGHIERIGDYVEALSRVLRAKAQEGVLFSDKAMDEINFLFEKAKDILVNTADLLLAPNLLVAGYVREAELALTRSANEFSTLHEERLIEGLCLPKASSLYLDMLDAFKAIAWHAKEIARKVVE